MNQISIFSLKALRKIYAKIFSVQPLAEPECIHDADIASKLIYDKLMSKEPCMIARFGATELMTLVNYLGVHKEGKKSIFKHIQGKELDWWWNKNCLRQMQQWSGFFPPTVEKIEQFCELMIADINEVDILGSWLANEKHFKNELLNIPRVHLLLLEPYWSKFPWTKALKGKNILVVHPFAELIEQQYKDKRVNLFDNSEILPTFNLQTIKAVQSLGGETTDFQDWFEALDWMKKEIDKCEYDICLLGCGAYGFPLAAYIKRQGKKAFHLGGALQLLFGIKGKRWENPNYGVLWHVPSGYYLSLMNNYWIKPGDKFKPENPNLEGDGCYW
jgi:hypothetical protein